MSSAAIALDRDQRRGLRDWVATKLGRAGEVVSATGRAIAKMLGLCESTARHWRHRGADLLSGIPRAVRGRRRRLADRVTVNDICTVIDAAAGRLSVRALKAAYPDVGRAQLEKLLRQWRRAHARDRRRTSAVLRWTVPGTVWAMDFTDFPGGIEDIGRDVLVVRDLASGVTLWSGAHPAQDAASVCRVLTYLLLTHAAPLVIKCDNGSCFVAGDTQQLLASHEVLPHFSPPGIPSYNGSGEAGVGSVKHRALAFAAQRGAEAPVTLDDLERARAQANLQVVPGQRDGSTRTDVWRARQAVPAQLRRELACRSARWEARLRDEQGIADGATLCHARQASLDRFAIREALLETRLLVIR